VRKRNRKETLKYRSPSQRYDHVYMGFDAINQFRANEGLPPIKQGMRVCISCEKQFYSEDIDRVRMCTPCKDVDTEHKTYTISISSL
jgi:hypothetical protein